MTPHNNKRLLIVLFTFVFGHIFFIAGSSFCCNVLNASIYSLQQKDHNYFEFVPDESVTPGISVKTKKAWRSDDSISGTNLSSYMPNEWIEPLYLSFGVQITTPFFPLVYNGNGINHMNINLVNLNLTGLKVGDEIGVFDGIYCVGSAVFSKKNMEENSLSIPASANDTVESDPNGYIQGHTITLKAYRDGIVYLLFFQTVNNTKDIFEIGASMFAKIDFSQSTGNVTILQKEESKIYPNPFDQFLSIEIYLPKTQRIKCEIFDINGLLIRTLFDNQCRQLLILVWDGKDNNNHQIPSGVYFCRVNYSVTRVIYNKQNMTK